MVYPNPAESELTLSLAVSKTELATILVYNSLGQIVREVSTQAVAGEWQHTLQTANLPIGLYTLTIKAADWTTSTKFLK